MGVLLDATGPRRVDAALLLVATAGAFAFALARSFGFSSWDAPWSALGVSVWPDGLVPGVRAVVPQERLATVNSRAFAWASSAQ